MEEELVDNLVSIVIPVYNCEKFLKDTIKTIQEQTYTNWEAFFVDDCSKDNSVEIIKEAEKSDSRIKLIKLEKNSGAAIARNTGIKNAKGRYIAFLDSDDLWEKEKLEKQLKFIKEGNYAFTFTGYEFIEEDGTRTGKKVHVPKELTYKQALKNTVIFTSTVIFDISILGKKLIEMPNIKRGQDSATWWKVLKNNNIAYGLDENLSLYRRSKGTLSSNKIKALKRTWNLYRNVEHFSVFKSMYYFSIYVVNAIKRRV